MDVKINQILIDFGMTIWKKKEEFKTRQLALRKENLALTTKTRKFKKPSTQKRKGKKPQGKHIDVSKL